MLGCKWQPSALPVLTTSRSLRSGSWRLPFSLQPEPIRSPSWRSRHIRPAWACRRPCATSVPQTA